MFKRNIAELLEHYLSISPVVLLTGARQTGKSTLMMEIAKEKNYHYLTFDDPAFLSAAQKDPIGFIAGLKKPVILDEIQRIPELFLAIKKDVDENRIAGRFALTGSANPLLIPNLSDSLAGRMFVLDLYPLSQGELQNTKEHFIDWAFNNTATPLNTHYISKRDLYDRILKGGYPSVQSFNSKNDQFIWFENYITTILYRDVQSLAQITGLTEFPKLLQLLATRVGNLSNVSELSRSISIPVSTLNRYLSLLHILYMIRFVQPWQSSLGKRLIKAPKTYLIDTGLLSYLLDLSLDKALSNPIIMGGVLENFVFGELWKQATWSSAKVEIYYYRTASGIEVDIVLEDRQGNIVGIEIKSADTVFAHDFKGLEYLREAVGDKFIQGIVLYTGSNVIPFGDKLSAVPISSLW